MTTGFSNDQQTGFVEANGFDAVPTLVPGQPASGWRLVSDATNSDTLKAISSTGTEVPLASASGNIPDVDTTETGSTLASASTVDLGATTTMRITITGSTQINSFGTVPNQKRYLRFNGRPKLTYNATSLILPGRATRQTDAGDTMIATSDASGNWTVRHWQAASGAGVIDPPFLPQGVVGDGIVDNSTTLNAANTTWNTNATVPSAQYPGAAMKAFYISDGRFLAATGALTWTGVGQGVVGDGADSQLDRATIEIGGSKGFVRNVSLIGTGAFGVKFSSTSRRESLLSNIIVRDRAAGIWSAEQGAQDFLCNILAEKNDNNYLFTDTASFIMTNFYGGTSNSHNFRVNGGQQLKLSNGVITAAQTGYNFYVSGDDWSASGESYLSQITMSGAAKTRIIPMLSVANSGGFARITIAVAKSISGVADAGNRMQRGATGVAAKGYVAIVSGTAGDTLAITVGGTAITSAPVAYNTSPTQTVIDVVANINAYTGSSGYTAQAKGTRILIKAPFASGGSANWQAIVATATGTLVISGGRFCEITTSTAHGFNAGDSIFVTGTTDYNGEMPVSAAVSATVFGVQLIYTSSQTGSCALDYALQSGLIGVTLTGAVYNTSAAKITATSSDPITYIDTDQTYVSNDTGAVSLVNWDEYLDANDQNGRIFDYYHMGGNQNYTRIASAFNVAYIGTRLKQQLYISPRAYAAFHPSQVFIVGNSRGRDDDGGPIDVGGAVSGWGRVTYRDDSGGFLPGAGCVSAEAPYAAGGRVNGKATFLNHVRIYEDKLTFGVNGATYAWDSTGLSVSVLAGAVALVAPTTGQSVTIPNATLTYVVKAAGSLLALTVVMPATPANGQVQKLSFTQAITTLTHSPNSGQSISGALTAATANSFAEYVYRTADTTWYRTG